MTIPNYPDVGDPNWGTPLHDAIYDFVTGLQWTVEDATDINWTGAANGKVLTYNGTSSKGEWQSPASVTGELAYAENKTGTTQTGLVPTTAGAIGTTTDLTGVSVSITGPFTRPVWLRYQFGIRTTTTGVGLVWAILSETTSPASGAIANQSQAHPVNTGVTAAKDADRIVQGSFRLGPVTDTTLRTFKLSVAVSGSSTTAPTILVSHGTQGSRSYLVAEQH